MPIDHAVDYDVEMTKSLLFITNLFLTARRKAVIYFRKSLSGNKCTKS
jgi:hypothetical protein